MTTSEGYITSTETNKIYEIPNGWFAGAGTLPDIAAVREWLEAGAVIADKPTVSEDFNGIVIWDGSGFVLDNDLVFQSCKQATGGSGWVVASAALKLGKSAKQAVELASTMCLGVGGKTVVVKVIE